MKLTPHFTFEELTITSKPYKNTPDVAATINLCCLAHYILEPLRIALNAPVTINSGYRSTLVNKAVGGVPSSQHLTGCAADIQVKNQNHGKRIFDILKTLYYVDQLLYEHSAGACWIHVSFSWTPRHIFRDNYKA